MFGSPACKREAGGCMGMADRHAWPLTGWTTEPVCFRRSLEDLDEDGLGRGTCLKVREVKNNVYSSTLPASVTKHATFCRGS